MEGTESQEMATIPAREGASIPQLDPPVSKTPNELELGAGGTICNIVMKSRSLVVNS